MSADGTLFGLEGVVKRYGSHAALDNVSFSVRGHEYISLLGPSGSGKTVLLRAIAGFEPLDAGRVTLAGRDITEVPAHQRGIGFVFQNFALFPHLSLFDNVAFGLRNGAVAVAPDEVRQRAHDAIELVGLKGLEGRGIGQLSGGQKQRVALARTLVTKPALILLDEPLGALDANLRLRMRIELRRIREQLGIPFLHVTGSETEALAMGDRVIVLDQGRIAQFGIPDDIYDRPSNPNVAKFLNRYNIFPGRIDGSVFESAYGKLGFGTRTAGDQPAYAIRYDRISPQPRGAKMEGVGLTAKYVASEYLGASIVHFFEASDGKVVEVEHHLSNGPPSNYAAGEGYLLTWKPADAIVFG
jgi:spermidine/putrescine transport system ATP-binding protein